MTLEGHYALCFKTRASFGAHCENLTEDRYLYCQRQRCSLVTLVSVNIKFVPIFEGVHWREGVKRRGVIENMDFHGFRRYVFSSLRNETNVIVYYYLIPCRLSTDPEIYDLG